MKLSIGRYRLQIGLTERQEPAPDRSTHDLQDHELAALQNAEREYRDTAWADRSLLNGSQSW